MMENHMRLLIKLLTVLVIVVIIILVIRSKLLDPQAGDSVVMLVAPEKVMRLEISSAGSTAILERGDHVWRAATLFGYPAKSFLVDGFMAKLETLTVLSAINPDASMSYGTEVKLFGADDKLIDSFELGDIQESGLGGRSIRLKDGQEFVVAEFFDEASAKSVDWVDRSMISLPDHSIEQISVIGSRAEYSIQRINDEYRIIGKPEDANIDQALAKRMFGLYERLQFESVVDPGLSDEAAGLAEYELLNIQTRDGFVYVIHVGNSIEGEDTKAIRIQVEFRGQSEPNRIQAQIQADREFVNANGELNVDEARQVFREKKYAEILQAHEAEIASKSDEARTRSAFLAPWRYKLLSSMLEQMMPTPDQLLKN